MCTGLSAALAFCSSAFTGTPPGSPRKYAINAKLSSTVAGKLGLLQIAFFLFMFRPLLSQWLVTGLAFQQTEAAFNHRRGDRLQQDAVGRGLDDGARAFLDVELLPQPARDHHLPFHAEIDRIGFSCRLHGIKSYLMSKSKSTAKIVG